MDTPRASCAARSLAIAIGGRRHERPTNNHEVRSSSSFSLFKFKNSDIRVVQIDGEPWFVGAEVCRSIGLAPNRLNGSFQNHLRRLSGDETRILKNPTAQNRRMTFLSESGLYKLVMRSDKPEAKEFQNWVTKVILPAIRKDGGYIHGEEHVVSGAMTEDELVFKAMEVMKREKIHTCICAKVESGSFL